jgi:site-specific recombinase XerC
MSHGQNSSNPEGVHQPVKFETLIDGWAAERKPMPKTIYEYKRTLANLAIFLGHDDAIRLSSQDLVAWKAKMIGAGLNPKTILGAKLAPVRAILQWAADNHHLPSNCRKLVPSKQLAPSVLCHCIPP